MAFRFTQEEIKNAPAPAAGRTWLRDPKAPGLQVCITAAGTKTYYVCKRITGRRSPARIRIGTVEELTLDRARRRAGELVAQIASGRDPLAERDEKRAEAQRERASIGDLWESYRTHHLAQKRPATIKAFEWLYEKYLDGWTARAAEGITFADVEKLKTEIGREHGQYSANRAVALIRAMYRRRGHAFGLQRGYSPTAGVDMFPEKPRDRVLTVEELGKVMSAIEADDNDVVRDYFKLLIFTGMRRETVARMAWQDLNISGGTWKIPGEKTKNGHPLVVNLIPEALAIIKARDAANPPDSPFVLPARRVTPAQIESVRTMRATGKSTRDIGDELGLSQSAVMRAIDPTFKAPDPIAFNGAGIAWRRILARAGLQGRTSIHDLRRTFCTMLIEKGTPLPVVAAAMGHRDLATTNRHYSFVSDKVVSRAVNTTMSAVLAEIGDAQATEKKNKAATGAA